MSESLAFRLRLQLLRAWAIRKCGKGKLKGKVGSTGWCGRGGEKATGRRCKSAWVTATHIMTACTPISRTRAGSENRRQPGSPRKKIYWCTRRRVMGKRPGRGRPVGGIRFHAAVIRSTHRSRMRHTRRSIEIINTPGVRAAETRGSRRIGGSEQSRTIPPDRADNTWRTHRGKSSHTRESGADRRRRPPPRMEQKASRTREHQSNMRLDSNAFRTEKHKDANKKRE